MAVKTVTGKLTDPAGANIAAALVTSRLSAQAVVASTNEIAASATSTLTAADGTWSLSLQSNADLTPATTSYTISVGTAWQAIVVVPTTAGPFKVEDIMASAPAVSPPAALDSAVVHLALTETITGVKSGPFLDYGGAVYNVKAAQFGGAIAGDWTVAIQAALDLGIAFVPPAATPYTISASLVENRKYNPTLIGAGPRLSMLAPTTALAGLPIIDFQDCRDGTVLNLGIKGTPSGSPALCAVRSRRVVAAGTVGAQDGARLHVAGCLMGDDVNNTSLQYGVEWSFASTNDTNNDDAIIFGNEITQFTVAAFHIAGVNSTQLKLIGNSIKGTRSAGQGAVVCDGGAFTMMGGTLNELGGTEFVFNSTATGVYRIVDTFSEDDTPSGAGGIVSTHASATVDITFDNYNRFGGTTAAGPPKLVDHQAAGELRFIGCKFQFGQVSQVVNAAHASGTLSFSHCGMDFTDIQYNGKLILMGNKHAPSSVTLTNLGSGTRLRMGDNGGGFTTTQIELEDVTLSRGAAGAINITAAAGLTSVLRVQGGATSNAQVLIDSGLQQAFVQWLDNAVAHWQLYHIHSDGSLYLRDLVNSKMHVTYTPGAGTAGLTDVNSALKVEGNVGFYATTPVTKPTVAGSRAANAALASLLTALAGQGLLTDSSTA